MLSDHNFKTFYSTSSDDIPEQFYNIAMQESCAYDRVSGYFSSKALAYYSKGIEGLLDNRGKYRLIISHEISESDYRQIVQGYDNRKDGIEKELYNSLTLEKLNREQKRYLSNLGYLIEIGLVDIKIGFTHSGLFHAKFGLFRDSSDNILYFSGSLNETEAGFKKNYEEISVIKSWETNDSELKEKVTFFDKLWNNKVNNGMVFVKTIDEVVKSKIISFSQGKIVIDSLVFEENALILYYDNGLHLKNNLGIPLDLTQRSLKKIIKKQYSDDKVRCFNSELSYVDVQEIVKLFNRYSERTNCRLIVSDSVEKFIKESEFKIQEIAKRGIAIKNKDEIFLNDFEKFNSIVESEVNRQLYEIQSWVSFYQATMKRVANFSVPGAGKTSMILGTFAFLSSKQIDKIDRIIVIGPKNSFISWKEEFKTVFKDKKMLKLLDVHDSNFYPEMFYKNVHSYNLILINYESLIKYREELLNIVDSRTMLVFDEVHKIKNLESQKAQFAIELSRKANYRYVLTGTPIPNSYQDIWNFLHILYDFEFNEYFGLNLASLYQPDPVTIQDVNTKLNPFFWRVTKKELNVPKENEDNIINVTANDSEQELINILWKKFSHNPFKLYIRLIQLSSNPQLLKDEISIDMYGDYNQDDDLPDIEIIDEKPKFVNNELALINSISTSSKYAECLKTAQKLIDEGKIIVVWCIFVDTINKMKDDLIKKGFRVAVIYGGIESSERERIILDFQKGRYDVLVTNPHTLAESVSLHMVAHDALYLEYSFNLTHMLQSRDRIHRLGLKSNQETNYYYFMLDGQFDRRSTIDKKIYERLNDKKSIMYDAIESPLITPEFTIDEKNEILQMMNEEIEK